MSKTKSKSPARPPIVRAYYDDGYDIGDEVIADNFAGGGGASTGIELGLGRSPDLAVNHDPEAIAMHAANHPGTEHRIESVWEVDPRIACRGKPVAFAWFSPDCKHFSKSKGGKPREQKIRGLAWVAVTWAQRVQPRVIALENVEEFQDWGPLHRTHSNGCNGEGYRERRINGRTRETQGCRKACHYSKPIANRKGETYRAFVGKLERLGYVVEKRLLRACDYGAPTTRRRLILIARRDGRPIRWPEPSHGPDRAAPHRTAAEIIDWSIPAPSIFDRERPLADKTLARIARGIRKFVIEASENGRPFIVPTAHGGAGRNDLRVHSIDEPLRTVTGSSRGDHAIAVPYLVHRSNGERVGQAPRIYDPQKPLGTLVAGGQKHAACVAWLVKHYTDRPTGGWNGGSDIARPIDTVTARDHHSLATVHLTKFYGTSTGSSLDEPVPTVTASGKGGGHLGKVVAFLARYNGTGEAESVERPLGTLTTKDRYALATVEIDGETYAIVDIGMRMLTPRELFRAQGFPETYKIDPPGPTGKRLTKTAQIRMCGNSVCPPLAAAIVRAQFQISAIQEAA